MIPRKLPFTKPLSYKCSDVPLELSVYSIGELYDDLDKFLNKYFDGAYYLKLLAPKMAKVYASVDVLAMIARKAIEAAFGAHVIDITVTCERGFALFAFSAEAPIFKDELSSLLSVLKKDEKTEIEATESTIVYKTKLLKLPICRIRANSSKTLYHVLEHWVSI